MSLPTTEKNLTMSFLLIFYWFINNSVNFKIIQQNILIYFLRFLKVDNTTKEMRNKTQMDGIRKSVWAC